jgi:hypothetical protein
MEQGLQSCVLLHDSQKFGYPCNKVSQKSQADNREGPGFSFDNKMNNSKGA